METSLKRATQEQREELTSLLGPAMRNLAKGCRDIFQDRAAVEALLSAELAQMPEGTELPGAGSLFIGEGGVMILPHVAMPQLYPQSKFSDFKRPEVKAGNHWHDWVDAVLAGKKTTDGFEYAGPLSETVQLGNIAARLPGTKLEWNSETMTITGHDNAAAMLTKSYRSGFEVEAVG